MKIFFFFFFFFFEFLSLGQTHESFRNAVHCDSSVFLYHSFNIGWTIGVVGFDSRQELGIFLFNNMSRPALGPIQPPTQWVPGTLSLGVKRPGCEADHSPPSSSEMKERVELHLHSSNTSSRRGA
jgi:hypothetical protein